MTRSYFNTASAVINYPPIRIRRYIFSAVRGNNHQNNVDVEAVVGERPAEESTLYKSKVTSNNITSYLYHLQYLGHKSVAQQQQISVVKAVRLGVAEVRYGYGGIVTGSHSADLLGSVCLTTDTYSLRIT